jgi:hypothetical protein
VIRPQDSVDEPDRGRSAGYDKNGTAEHLFSIKKMVDGRGLEPPTSALRTPRSPN